MSTRKINLAAGRMLAIEPRFLSMAQASAEGMADSGVPVVKRAFGFRDGSGAMRPYTVDGSVAIVKIDGPLVRQMDFFGWLTGGIETSVAAAAIRMAADDPAPRMLIDLHCPGGEVSGCDELFDAMRYARKKKPVHAIAHDMAASLALPLLVMATEAVATPTACVGSAGSLWLHYDESEAFKEAGVRPVPVNIGEFKAAGYPGVAITPEAEQSWRNELEANFEVYLAALKEGRGITRENVVAMKAATFDPLTAKQNNLIDRVVSFAAYAEELKGKAQPTAAPRARATAGNKPARKAPMIDEATPNASPRDPGDEIETPAETDALARTKPAAPASFADLSAAFGAKAGGKAFAFDCLEKNMTLMQAHQAYAEKLEAENASLNTRLAATAKIPTPKAAAPVPFTNGPSPVANGEGQAFSTYQDALAHYKAVHGGDLVKATREANLKHPELRATYAAAPAR